MTRLQSAFWGFGITGAGVGTQWVAGYLEVAHLGAYGLGCLLLGVGISESMKEERE